MLHTCAPVQFVIIINMFTFEGNVWAHGPRLNIHDIKQTQEPHAASELNNSEVLGAGTETGKAKVCRRQVMMHMSVMQQYDILSISLLML